MKKVCSTCEQEKELDEFYRHRRKDDGRHGQCKACMNIAFLVYDGVRDRLVMRQKQRRAGAAVKQAVERGDLPRVQHCLCADCNLEAAQEYHHNNGYEIGNWLDVDPLCIPCHRQRERGQMMLPIPLPRKM